MMRPLVTGIILSFAAMLPAANPALQPLKAGIAAPTFSLPSLDRDRVSLRVFCGDTLLKPHVNNTRHIVVLSFWATYCKPCQKEIPALMKFAEKHTKDSIKIFCISIDKEGEQIVVPFVNEKKYTLPVLLDPYRKTAERYSVGSLPALFVLDGRGIIRYSTIGYDEASALDAKLEGIIADIRAGRAVAAAPASSQGESVAVDETAPAPQVPVAKPPLTPKDRWDAIVAVECGVSLERLSDSLGVDQTVIKGWYADLKKAAMTLWEPGGGK